MARILIVEDDGDILEMLADTLREEGHDIVGANDRGSSWIESRVGDGREVLR